MGKLIYSAIQSLDGYVADANGKFDWAEPDPEVHEFINDLMRPIGIYLYGRKLYEVMLAWETVDVSAGESSHIREFAEIWQAADKIVYSKTLDAASSARTQIMRALDADAIQRMKTRDDRDISIGGPNLAAHAFKAGSVDECHLFVAPIVVGGGKRSLPDSVSQKLELEDERGFGNGMVYLRYRMAG